VGSKKEAEERIIRMILRVKGLGPGRGRRIEGGAGEKCTEGRAITFGEKERALKHIVKKGIDIFHVHSLEKKNKLS